MAQPSSATEVPRKYAAGEITPPSGPKTPPWRFSFRGCGATEMKVASTRHGAWRLGDWEHES